MPRTEVQFKRVCKFYLLLIMIGKIYLFSLPSIVSGSIDAFNYFAVCKNLFRCKEKTSIRQFKIYITSTSIRRQLNVYISPTSGDNDNNSCYPFSSNQER